MCNKSLVIIILSSCILSSCRKDKLKGDAEVLVGEWEWIETKRSIQMGAGGPVIDDYNTPASIGKTYTITFYKKGKIEIKRDDETIYKKRTIVEYFQVGDSSHNKSWVFKITNLTDGNPNNTNTDFSGWFYEDSDDTLYMRTVPYREYEYTNGSASYNKFVRK